MDHGRQLGCGHDRGVLVGQLDLKVSGMSGVWSGTSAGSLLVRRQLIAPFNAAGEGGAGTPNATGTLLENIQPGQFAGNIDLVNSANAFIVWQASWTPAIYAVQTITFALTAGSLGLPTYLVARDANGLELPVPGTVADTRGSVTVFVVPAPAGLALLSMAGLCALRPRRAGALLS
jgi:hypothetical protein